MPAQVLLPLVVSWAVAWFAGGLLVSTLLGTFGRPALFTTSAVSFAYCVWPLSTHPQVPDVPELTDVP